MRTERKVREPIVAISGKGGTEGDAMLAALSMLPVDRIISPNDTVVITPNWVTSEPPEKGTVVGPDTLRQLIRFIKSFGPRRTVVAAGSGGQPTPEVMKLNCFDRVIQDEGVEFVDLNYGPYIEITLDHAFPSKTKINRLLEELTVLISFSQLKVHSEATASMTIKNIALGWPPAEIHGFPKKNLGIHDDLHGFIYAMAEKIPIDLAILSTDKAMVGLGPSGGKPVAASMVIAGTDPVSVDTIGARLLGYYPQAINYLYRLVKAGVGEADMKTIQLRGLSLDEAIAKFTTAAYDYPISMK